MSVLLALRAAWQPSFPCLQSCRAYRSREQPGATGGGACAALPRTDIAAGSGEARLREAQRQAGACRDSCCLVPATDSSAACRQCLGMALLCCPRPSHILLPSPRGTCAHAACPPLPAAASACSGRLCTAAAAQQPAAPGEPQGSSRAGSSSPTSGGGGRAPIDWGTLVGMVISGAVLAMLFKPLIWIPVVGPYIWGAIAVWLFFHLLV